MEFEKKYLENKAKYIHLKRINGGSFPLDKNVKTIVDTKFFGFNGTVSNLPKGTILALKNDDINNQIKWLSAKNISNNSNGRVHRDDIIPDPAPQKLNVVTDIDTGIIYIIEPNELRPNLYSINPKQNLLANKTIQQQPNYTTKVPPFTCNKIILPTGKKYYEYCLGCGICSVVSDIEDAVPAKTFNFKSKFDTSANRYFWSTCWIKSDKALQNDIYFLTVPNEHIETIINPSAHDSYALIKNICAQDVENKKSFLGYLLHMVNDAFRFAREILKINVNYKRPTVDGGMLYDENNIDKNTLCIVVHIGDNSMPHVHLHCYINGNDDKFVFTQKNKKTGYGPRDDLFINTGHSVSIEYLYSTIANSITSQTGQNIAISADKLVLSRYDTPLPKNT